MLSFQLLKHVLSDILSHARFQLQVKRVSPEKDDKQFNEWTQLFEWNFGVNAGERKNNRNMISITTALATGDYKFRARALHDGSISEWSEASASVTFPINTEMSVE